MQVIEYHQKTSCWKPLKTQKTSENQENHHNNWLLDPVYHTWERDSVGDIPTFRIGPSNDQSHALTHHTTISCNPRKYHIPWRHRLGTNQVDLSNPPQTGPCSSPFLDHTATRLVWWARLNSSLNNPYSGFDVAKQAGLPHQHSHVTCAKGKCIA